MPGVLDLKPGAVVIHDNKRYVVKNTVDFYTVTGREEATGSRKLLDVRDLRPPADPDQPAAVEDRELSEIEKADWDEANRRHEIIKPLLSTRRRTREMVEELARLAGIHWTTVYSWVNAYESDGRVSSLAPYHPNGGRGKSRLAPRVEEILQEVLDDYYLGKKKYTAQETADEVCRRCRAEGISPPHVNTVRNRIASMSERKKVSRRKGSRAAREQFDPATEHFPGADWPLAVVQIDHTLLPIEVVDDVDRLAIGRPWLALAIDVYSRMVVGFYLSLDPPDAMSVGLCLSHAILPKEAWLAERGIDTPWPCWGPMDKVHADNAMVFRGNTLKRACQEHGIDLEWRPVKTPNYGGHIERLLGTFQNKIKTLSGTTFSNPEERGDYDSAKEAIMTLAELETWLATYIVEVYHQRVHSSIKTSPIKRYESGLLGSKDRPGRGLPPRVLDEERLRLDFTPYFERTIQRQYGVAIEEVHYYADVLSKFIGAKDPDHPNLKRKFIFRRDPRKISPIYFFDPELKRYFPIPYRDMSHPPASVWEIREVRRRLEEEGKRNIDEAAIFKGLERMRTQEQSAEQKTKRARKNRQRRSDHEKATNKSSPSGQQDPGTAESTPMEEEPKVVTPYAVVEDWD